MEQKCVVYEKTSGFPRNFMQVLKLRHNYSQSLVFGLEVLYLTGGGISRFWYIKTRGRKVASKYFFCYTYQCIVEILSIKKICHIQFN